MRKRERMYLPRVIVVALWFCCYGLMTSCTGLYDPSYNHPQVRQCIKACKVQQQRCQRQCDDSCALCLKKQKLRALSRYNQYRHERCTTGKSIIRTLQSYYDPLQCKKSSCDCTTDFRVCAEACWGLVNKRLQIAEQCCS